jgi:hypothetical protein
LPTYTPNAYCIEQPQLHFSARQSKPNQRFSREAALGLLLGASLGSLRAEKPSFHFLNVPHSLHTRCEMLHVSGIFYLQKFFYFNKNYFTSPIKDASIEL